MTPSSTRCAITSLAVRGAPAIGLAGALGVALSAHRHTSDGATDEASVKADAARLSAARPTAVNLAWAVDLAWAVRRAVGRLADGPQAVLAEAMAMLEEDATANRTAVVRAADLVQSLVPDRPVRIPTHCNTGRLATAAVGTALGAIIELHERGRVAEVLVDETRPLLQGARLTAWELGEAGVPYRLCVDSAAAAAMARGMVDCVPAGADRIAANGDVANKIGTYGLAVAAARQGRCGRRPRRGERCPGRGIQGLRREHPAPAPRRARRHRAAPRERRLPSARALDGMTLPIDLP